ncbi:MAG: RNA polymerase sigma factor [Clostridia bacterium]
MEVTKDYISDLLDKYGDMVLRIAYTYLKNRADAEDIVQDVFLRIIDKKPSFNDENHEKSWLIRATINMCKNKVNMFWNKNKCSIDDVQEFAVSDKYNTDTSVFQAVMALGEKYRVVVYMYYYEGYSTPEIAKVIGKSETTIRSLLHRARNKLKDMLKEDYDFE